MGGMVQGSQARSCSMSFTFDTNNLLIGIGIIHSKLWEESVSPMTSGLTAVIGHICVLLGIG